MSQLSHERLARFHVAVGETMRKWVTLEITLTMVFCAFLHTDQFRGRIVWNSLPNFRARRRLLTVLAATYLDEPYLSQFNSLLKRAKTLGENRNALAHSWGGLQEDGQPSLVRDQPDSGDGFNFFSEWKLTLENVEGWPKAIESLTDEINDLAASFEPLLHSSPKIHRRQARDPKR